MNEKDYYTTFYLDKEKDIVINLYKFQEDELEYVIETPNHSTGNLISNLAKICNVKLTKNEKGMKVIKGKIPASINSKNEDVYIFRLGGYRIADIVNNKFIQLNGQIPAIAKTLMSQTKEYNIPIEKTIVKSYILKKLKFRTDLHTHMNANLSPACLIALGIKHQIKYPLYYIKKLNLKMSKTQEKSIYNQRKSVEEKFKNSKLQGKKLERKIDDNTFINFADFILNNLENSKENIEKIEKSLALLKDGQAVFTNLEKLYLYRYVFTKGEESEHKINLKKKEIEKIPNYEIKNILQKMLEDLKEDSNFRNNNLREDKLLWIGREYKLQGIKYVEISDTTLTKKGDKAAEFLEELHNIMPKIEKETGVKIRFLVAIRRIQLSILEENINSDEYLIESLNVLKAVSKSPYVVGCDFIGEEINDIIELKPVIKEIVQYAVNEDLGYTIRIHAGENDSLKNNVANAISCIQDSLEDGQKVPKIRIGHGLYTADLESKEGKELINKIKKMDAVMEFQITSNVRLNNLSNVSKHPLKKYLQNGIKCVQGTDGCGAYGIDTIDEQLALQNLLEISEEEFLKMRETEDQIIKNSEKYFEKKKREFEIWLNGRNLKDAILELEDKYFKENKYVNFNINNINKVSAKENLDSLVVQNLPMDKMPIIIAGGSFNAKGKNTTVEKKGSKILENIVCNAKPNENYFVIGHMITGYEKEIIDICKKENKKFDIYAIIPNMISNEVKERILDAHLTGVCVSIESEDSGIYKSFNYEIFERRSSILYAFDGNSPVSNLVQEAKNGKGKAKIYVNGDNENLRQKAEILKGYVTKF